MGVAPRMFRQLLASIYDLQRQCIKHLNLPLERLLPPSIWPPIGRDGAFKVHLLRVSLVWSFSSYLVHADIPSAAKTDGGASGASSSAASSAGAAAAAAGGGGVVEVRKVVVVMVVVSMPVCMRRLVHSYPQAAAVSIH